MLLEFSEERTQEEAATDDKFSTINEDSNV
jgi:hypothetical protein